MRLSLSGCGGQPFELLPTKTTVVSRLIIRSAAPSNMSRAPWDSDPTTASAAAQDEEGHGQCDRTNAATFTQCPNMAKYKGYSKKSSEFKVRVGFYCGVHADKALCRTLPPLKRHSKQKESASKRVKKDNVLNEDESSR